MIFLQDDLKVCSEEKNEDQIKREIANKLFNFSCALIDISGERWIQFTNQCVKAHATEKWFPALQMRPMCYTEVKTTEKERSIMIF